MAFTITDECIACGSCKEECPTQAIKDKAGKFIITHSECIECATCMETCPSGAIVDA